MHERSVGIATASFVPHDGVGRARDLDVERVASSASARSRILDCLAEHGALGGQGQVFSRDPWHVLWGPGRKSFVPFLERRFSLLAWRDPVGPRDCQFLLLRNLLEHAKARGKHVCVLGASSRLAAQVEDLGYGAVWMGAEQELALPSFHLRGKQGAKLRLAINHARTMHCHARELFPLSSPADAQAIAAVEAAWKAPRKALQTDSFLRTAPLEYAELRRYFGVETHGPDQDASLQTLVVCSPVSRRAAYLQDFLRRPEAPRGAMEMAAVAAFEGLRRDGVSSATMGIVPFFGPSHAESIGFTGRLAQQCIRRFVYRFEGLQQFRAKFTASRVEPVYALHYPRSVSLLAIWDLVTSLAPRANQAKRTKPAGQGVTEPA